MHPVGRRVVFLLVLNIQLNLGGIRKKLSTAERLAFSAFSSRNAFVIPNICIRSFFLSTLLTPVSTPIDRIGRNRKHANLLSDLCPNLFHPDLKENKAASHGRPLLPLIMTCSVLILRTDARTERRINGASRFLFN